MIYVWRMSRLSFDQVNVVVPDVAVDAAFQRALALGADGLRAPYDAFGGARYAVVRGPGPIIVGVTSPVDPTARGATPPVADFA